MSNYYRYIILALCFLPLRAGAFEVFLDPLYWQATESIEWVLSNNLNAQNQNINYKTIQFGFQPGIRVGVSVDDIWDNWHSRLYYTRYQTTARSSATGNLVSTFLGGKLAAQGNFFTSGQVVFKIDFNMFDWDIYKPVSAIDSSDNYYICPILGLRGGSINQNVISYFQGPFSLTEYVKNNFQGVGPKIGIEGKWVFYCLNNYQFSFFSAFTSSCLWGQWIIQDQTLSTGPINVSIHHKKRKFGAFTLEGILGINLDYDCFRMKLGYEIADWFNQYQVLDDGTGGHNNDLILQGLTLHIGYKF